MFRIDTPTAALALPAPAAAGTPGYFTGGNPGTGVPPTTISPDWLNEVQEELAAVIAAASIALAKGTNNQLLTALQALFVSSANAGGSFGSSGYIKVPGGGIIQWGQIGSYSSESGLTASLPIAFPNAGRAAFAVVNNATGSISFDQGAQAQSLSTTTIGIFMQIYGGGTSTFPCSATWFAIGN